MTCTAPQPNAPAAPTEQCRERRSGQLSLEEINTLFDAAVSRSMAVNREDLPERAHRRAGLKAVVEALRDE